MVSELSSVGNQTGKEGTQEGCPTDSIAFLYLEVQHNGTPDPLGGCLYVASSISKSQEG